MNIEEFVRESLKQIAAGATSVEDKETGQCVVPDIPVQFDLAVVTTDEKSGDAGAKLKVASLIDVGGEGKIKSEIQEYNRVSFTLGFKIPSKSFGRGK